MQKSPWGMTCKRAKVEHVIRILKLVFGCDKVRCRGIAKNHHRLCPNFFLVNLYFHRKRLLCSGSNVSRGRIRGLERH